MSHIHSSRFVNLGLPTNSARGRPRCDQGRISESDGAFRRSYVYAAAAGPCASMLVAPLSAGSSTIADLYAYPGGTGTTCTTNTSSTSDCSLQTALTQAEASSDTDVNLYLESTGESLRFEDGPYQLDASGSVDLTIEPAPGLEGTSVLYGGSSSSAYSQSIFEETGTGNGTVTFESVSFQNASSDIDGALTISSPFPRPSTTASSMTTRR